MNDDGRKFLRNFRFKGRSAGVAPRAYGLPFSVFCLLASRIGGGVSGDARNGTVIENCSVSGGQIIVTGGGYAGGLVGYFSGSGTSNDKSVEKIGRAHV